MDISATLAPNSDQLDAVDLLQGARIFTITKVTKGDPEQPVQVALAEFPRVWRPAKSMRRVLAACWGVESSVWIGRRVELYCDESVKFGGDAIGGTRISKLSHIDGPRKIPLLVSRGKSAMYVVEPLTAAPTSPAVSDETLAELVTTFRAKGVPEEKWLEAANWVIKGAATALEVITEDHALKVLAELRKRPDVEQDPIAEHEAALNAEAAAQAAELFANDQGATS